MIWHDNDELESTCDRKSTVLRKLLTEGKSRAKIPLAYFWICMAVASAVGCKKGFLPVIISNMMHPIDQRSSSEP